MKTTFNDAGEQEIRTVVLYGHTDNFLYIDEKHTAKAAAADVLNVCMKGLLLVTADSETFTAPIAFKRETNHVSVNVETGNAAVAAIKTYKSDNFSA